MDGLLMKYFVLKPRGNDVFARASRVAMRAYANTISGENPTFATELREWADREAADAAMKPKPRCRNTNPQKGADSNE